MKKRLRILLVDDDEVDRMAVRRTLCKLQKDVTIDEAVDIAGGLKALNEENYDCAIVDYLLPDGTGLSLVNEAVAQLNLQTPIIMLTGKGDRDIDIAVMEAGASDYLEKDGLRADLLDRTIRYAIQNKRLILELKKVNGKLRELDKLKSEFLSTASHELRTPLTIIREFVSLVHDGVAGSINEEQKDCMGSALGNCDRLAQIINDLLDLQKIESGRVKLDRKKQNMAGIVKRCCHEFIPRLDTKKQNIELNIQDNLPDVLCDQDKIVQVLVNLIGNAHKFTPEGGSVVVNVYPEGLYLNVEVEDSGPGIALDDREKIFDKFTQINRQHGPGAKGTGLGLAITKKIVGLHGGKVSVEDAEKGGARFTISVPLYKDNSGLLAFVMDHLTKDETGEVKQSLILIDPEFSEECDLEKRLNKAEAIAMKILRRKNDRTRLFLREQNIGILIDAEEKGARGLLNRLVPAMNEEFGSSSYFRYCIVPIPVENPGQIAMELENLEYISIEPLSKEAIAGEDVLMNR